MNGLTVDALPLNAAQTHSLHAVVDELSTQQLQWVSAYVAGLAATSGAAHTVAVATGGRTEERLTVLFGSQTGNGEAIAAALARQIEVEGYATQVRNLMDYKPADLKRESLVVLVVSTHGEGDPPDDAEMFYEYLMAGKAPELDTLHYSVLALGDSSYVNFCQTGRELDARLAELGGTRFAPLAECDLDYDVDAASWSERVTSALPDLLRSDSNAAMPRLHAVETIATHDKKNPFAAEVLVNQKITGRSSAKDVHHIELSLQGSGIHYEPGDSLAVITENPPQLIDEILQLQKLDPGIRIKIGDDTMPLLTALQCKLEITAVNVRFLRLWAALSEFSDLDGLLADGRQDALKRYIETHQIVDVMRDFPVELDAQGFVAVLRTLSPRSYSISSSLAANPDEVHLTVAAVRYQSFGQDHWGAASTQLVDRLDEGDSVFVYVEKNSRFRLPQTDVPVIMIGPGTGIAPFRAFIEERKEQAATGGNWLFFGERKFDSDFLYQSEWQRHMKNGHLQRLDVAFSRDQRHKIYVQDRLRERGAELYRWIEFGAAVYVCGDAKRMASDVHDALLDVIEAHGELSREAARQKLRELRAAGRYQRDVY
jgi:sulfite reductase (NADPH) flavoprotein alpha-component